MQEIDQDVMNIRRICNTIFLLLLLLALTPKAQAASIKAGAVTTAAGSLNVRSQPTSASSVAATLKKGSYITLHSQTGQWWRVEYDKGKYGYCHSRYITQVQGTPVSVSLRSGSLNVRTGPGTGYARSASLYSGQTVLLLTTSGDWSRVLYHGTKTGWVSSRYLSGSYPAVSVTVPSFKQTDSRWADKTVGTSGKPFSQIGCATTAVAMMESARQGRTIYPDEMSRQLQYTASGDLYWPSHYTPSTNASGYLERIYQMLSKGKPVLLGMKNAGGSQHWVVVTGFQGGTALTPSAFTIHDPGTSTRTTLAQLQAVYPTFYKYFAY
ncbi:MAG TPA: hypothetical protein DCO69_06685 [Clostridiales bacterium]|nr:hypothetical protein [Clostridiales bacterium]